VEDIARQLLVYGRRVPKAELFARIDAVDEETVKEVASRFIYDQARLIRLCPRQHPLLSPWPSSAITSLGF
jgi:hypothetical protein